MIRMGFATSRIVLEFNIPNKQYVDETVTDVGKLANISRGQIEFWEILYNNVLQEYLYVNKLKLTIALEVNGFHDSSNEVMKSSGVDRSTEKCRNVIVPLGGGKGNYRVVIIKVNLKLKCIHLCR